MHAIRLLRMRVESGDILGVVRNEDRFAIDSTNPEREPSMAQRIREDAFTTVIAQVKDAPLPNCELIYSEAWNVVEHTRRYRELINVLEQSHNERANNGEYFPSYGHVLLARAYAREGAPGWAQEAESNLLEAHQKAESESPLSTWFTSTRKEIVELQGTLSLIGGGATPRSVEGTPGAEGEIAEEEILEVFTLMQELEASGREPSAEELMRILRVMEFME